MANAQVVEKALNGFKELVTKNKIIRQDPTLDDIDNYDSDVESEPASLPVFAGVGDFLPDEAEKIQNGMAKTDEEQERLKTFREELEELTRQKGYAFKSTRGEYRVRQGHERVATFKESGSMTWSHSDVAGADIQQYIAVLAKHKLAKETKPVVVSLNEKLIEGEETRIAFFRNTIKTLLENDIDIERIKIHNKQYQYLIDEFKPKQVADVGLDNGQQPRQEPTLDGGLKPAEKPPEVAGIGDAPAEPAPAPAPSPAAPEAATPDAKADRPVIGATKPDGLTISPSEDPKKPLNEVDNKAPDAAPEKAPKAEAEKSTEEKVSKGVKLEKEHTEPAAQPKKPAVAARSEKLKKADEFSKAPLNEDLKPLDVANHVYKAVKTTELYIAANEFKNANNMVKKARAIAEHYKAPDDVIKGIKHLVLATNNADDLKGVSAKDRVAKYAEDLKFAANATGEWMNEIKPKLTEEQAVKEAAKIKDKITHADILDAAKDYKAPNEDKINDAFKQSEIDEGIKKSTKRQRIKP